MMPTSLFRIETQTGKPIKIGDSELRVRSQVIQLRLPMANAGLIWNRPVAVLVRSSRGQEQIPIPDSTRLVVLILAGLALTSIFLRIASRRKKIES